MALASARSRSPAGNNNRSSIGMEQRLREFRRRAPDHCCRFTPASIAIVKSPSMGDVTRHAGTVGRWRKQLSPILVEHASRSVSVGAALYATLGGLLSF